MGMTLHEAIEVLKMYQYGTVGDMTPHSFDLNDETVETILAALEKPQKYKPPMEGWKNSRGANLEHAYAMYQGKQMWGDD